MQPSALLCPKPQGLYCPKADLYIDPHPYTGEYHLNLSVNDHVSTSILLVARRGNGS